MDTSLRTVLQAVELLVKPAGGRWTLLINVDMFWCEIYEPKECGRIYIGVYFADIKRFFYCKENVKDFGEKNPRICRCYAQEIMDAPEFYLLLTEYPFMLQEIPRRRRTKSLTWMACFPRILIPWGILFSRYQVIHWNSAWKNRCVCRYTFGWGK